MEKTRRRVFQQATSSTTTHAHHQQQSIISRVGYFIIHFLEMCAVMCVSLMIFESLSIWVGSVISYSNVLRQFPVLTTVVLAIWFTLIMIAWMRLRRHAWRFSLEMASTSMIALIPLLGAFRFGMVSHSDLTGLECGMSCVLMVVAMLLRLDHYTTSHANHRQHVPANQVGI